MASTVVKDLMDRHVPQYLAVYLGASWGVIEFFAFLEDRFLLSPHWTNLVLLTLLLLLPSVALFTYFHGRKGADRWNRVEKVAIPLNVALALVVLFGAFSGKELGAMTTTVTVEDEDGTEVVRTVAKSAFRKSLLLFPPAADSAEDEAWLSYGVLSALANDLFQDLFVDARHPALFRDRLRDGGFEVTGDIPRPLKRKIARDSDVPYFLDGDVERAGESYRVTLALHDAERGRTLQERTFEGTDLFELVDSAAVQLRRDLELPGRYIEETQDLPVTDHTTGSIEALRHYAHGVEAVTVRDDYATASDELEQAVAADPTFADASFSLYRVRLLSGDATGATAAIQAAMDHLYRLPERSQFLVKGEWYSMQQQWDKLYAIHEMWAELYPQDLQAHLATAQIRLFQDDRRGAIEALERVVELDPSRLDMVHRIGELYQNLGEADSARGYFERYRAEKPDDPLGFTSLAGLERSAGNHDAAGELYDRALLLEPDNVDLVVERAALDREAGAFEESRSGLEAALDAASTPEQRFTVLRALRSYYLARGAMTRALEYQEQALAAAREFQPPLVQIQLQLMGLGTYAEAGRGEAALQQLDGLAAQLPPPVDALVPLGKMGVYRSLERPEELAAAVEEGERMLERTGMKMLEQPILYSRGRLHEIRGEWREAAAAYERERALDPSDATIPAQIGRCQRALGALDEAESLMLETLRVLPAHARTHFELARVYEDMERPADAVRHLERALEIWAPADADFVWAERAREALQRVRG